jgi:molybdopterin converting factor small subunit
MAVTIHLPGPLSAYAGGARRVILDSTPASVGEALAALGALHPGVRDRVLDEQGQVRQHVNVFVGKESIRYTGGLSTGLAAGAELHIFPAVSGGLAAA